MSSVDDRIVNMTFNNKQFESGAATSMKTLTGLEKTLANTGKGKGLSTLTSGVQAVSTKFSAMQVAGTAALATIAAKATSAGLSLVKSFTIGPIMEGFQEYKTGLDSVQTIMGNTGKSVKVVNASLDELNEYSDQTIYNFGQMAKNIGTFTAAGVELDTAVSAIKGISNLAALSGSSSQQASTAMYQLSQAISAGRVSLQDWNSVVNAGMAGKQFKTALARTAVAMGDLSADAVKVGTDVEIMGQSFRQSISATGGAESWLSGDVLVKTLAILDGRFSKTRLEIDGFSTAQQRNNELTAERNKLAKEGVVFSDKEFAAVKKQAEAAFTAATQIKSLPQLLGVVRESFGSMYAGAFEIILGDFEQSKKLWTRVGDVITGPQGIIAGMSSSFLGTLRMWEEAGGRTKLIKGLRNVFVSLGKVLGTIKDAFQDVFPPDGANVLIALSSAFRRFTQYLKPSESTLESLRSIFGGVFAILHIGISIVSGIAKGFAAFFGALFEGTDGARGGILSLLGSVGEVIIAFDKWLTSGGKVQEFFAGLGSLAGTFLKPILQAISLVVDGFAALVSGEGLGGALSKFGEAKTIFSDFVNGIVTGLDQITAPFDGLKSQISDFAAVAFAPFQGFIDKLEEVRQKVITGLGLDQILPTMDGLETAFNRATYKVTEFFDQINFGAIPFDNFGAAVKAVGENIQALVEKMDISGKIDAIKDSVSGLFEAIGGAAEGGSGATMVAAAQDQGDAFAKLGEILSTVGDVIKRIFGLLGDAASAIGSTLADLFPQDALEWATALNLLLSGAIIKKLFFSKGIFDELADAIKNTGEALSGGIRQGFNDLTDTLSAMQNALKANILKNIAIAVALLTASLLVLSFIPIEKLKVGVGAIAAVMTLLTGTMFALGQVSGTVNLISLSTALVAMATAVLILTGAIAALGALPLENLQQGLAGIAAVLVMLVTAVTLMSGLTGGMATAGAGMVLMATAINMLVVAITALGLLPIDTLKQGLVGVAAGLTIMVTAIVLMAGLGPGLLAAGAAMIMMSIAMAALVGAIIILGLLPYPVLEQGLQAVAIGIGIMVAAILLLSGAGPAALAAGGAMVLFAISLNMLMTVILGLGAAPWEVVRVGLMAMGIALAILLFAAAGAMAVLPGLAALSTVILSIGAAVFLAGTGIALFVGALALLAAVGAAAVAVITAAIIAFIALLPNIAVQVAAAFVSFLQAIALAAPKIKKALITIFTNMIDTARTLIPRFGALMSDFLSEGLRIISSFIGDYVEMGFTIIDNFLKSAADHAPDIVESAIILVTRFMEMIGQRAGQLADAAAKMIIDFINAISTAIDNNVDDLRTAGRNLAMSIVNGLTGGLLEDGMAAVRSAVDQLAGAIPDWVKKKLGINSPSKVMIPLGFGIGEGVALGIYNSIDQAVTAATAMANAVVGATDKVFSNKQITASTKQWDAYSAQADANLADRQAKAMEKAAAQAEKRINKVKGKEEKRKAERQAKNAAEAATQARNKANRKQTTADSRQTSADAAEQAYQRELQFNESDNMTKSDMRSEDARGLASRAQQFLAEANAKAAEADRMAKEAKKSGKYTEKERKAVEAMREQSRADAAKAREFATAANAAMTDAAAYYAAARAELTAQVRERLAGIRQQQADEAKAKADEAELNATSLDKKDDLLIARAEANEKKAAGYEAAAEDFLRQAEALAASDPDQANLLIDKAEAQAQLADAAADRAKQEREQAAQFLAEFKQTQAQNGTPTDSKGTIIPSRTALEDAAKAVDRYTESMRQAQESAAAGQGVVQFVQNNNSPVALSTSDIYRQSKNLITLAEVKMAP